MSATKLHIKAATVRKMKNISKKFSQLNTGSTADEFFLITSDDTDGSYEGESISVGIDKKGNLLTGRDSVCSCYSLWEGGVSGEVNQKLGTKAIDLEFDTYLSHDPFDDDLEAIVDTLYKTLNGKAVTAQEIIGLPNAEIRRAVVEIVGFGAVVDGAEVVDESEVDGRLLRIKQDGDEDLVLIHVKDPSTDREYFLRVPPAMKTARQARAWTFGFEAEDFELTKES
jgi:hypothetical protein